MKIANLLGVGAGDIVRWHIYGDEGWIDSKIAAIYRNPTAQGIFTSRVHLESLGVEFCPTALVSAGRVADSFDGVDAVLSTADIVSAWEDFLMALMVVYDSKTGLGRSFAERVSDNTQSVEEALDAPCLLVTRNVGLGKIPGTTNTFLKRHAARRFGKHYCAAGPKMQAKYGVRIVRNIERDGDDEDVRAVTEFIKTLGQDVL
ncbi:MAG: class Ib ribonucleoside-diphosphate reductase assembly flavoprotein NrdI [Oscillospiraceae bacterium]|nr:class Ib ribonucleoside-diphosphate reductase assembly flavoprotein NrdI [Oscillospiraceae bacterium]